MSDTEPGFTKMTEADASKILEVGTGLADQLDRILAGHTTGSRLLAISILIANQLVQVEHPQLHLDILLDLMICQLESAGIKVVPDDEADGIVSQLRD